jgi:hypothetical protein
LTRYAVSALWVFGLLGAFLWWLNKKRGTPFAKHLDKKIQILEVYPMGLKNKMMLVQVDDQRMLLSMNTQDIRTLHAWQLPLQENKTTRAHVETQLQTSSAASPPSGPGPHEPMGAAPFTLHHESTSQP